MQTGLPHVKIEQFEGPYDLLLELARKRKVDVTMISLAGLTDDFLTFVKQKAIPAGVQASFLVVASTLLLLKIRHLLPNLTDQEEEEVQRLTDRVRIYTLYRRQAERLAHVWQTKRLLPAHFWGEGTYQVDRTQVVMPNITSSDIANHMDAVISNIPKPATPTAHLRRQPVTLASCLALFQQRLKRVQTVVFQQSVGGKSTQEIAMSLLAVMEMARNGDVELRQASQFGELVVRSS